MWTYSQSTGRLTDSSGALAAIGYSGNGEGKNDPLLQELRDTGPIPRGKWIITEVYDSERVGPFALKLEPAPGTKTFGRSAFRIHGDSIAHPGEASDGCIVVPRTARKRVWDSGDRELLVIA